MKLFQESITVQPNIGLLNRYAQKAKQVAITGIKPVFSGYEAESQRRNLMALRIQVEGPKKDLDYFGTMLKGAKLSIDS